MICFVALKHQKSNKYKDSFLSVFRCVSHVERLCIDDCSKLNESSVESFFKASAPETLKEFSSNRCNFSNVILEDLRKARNLSSLHLSYCRSLDVHELLSTQKNWATSLRNLSLAGCSGVNDTFLKLLSQVFTRVEVLDISHSISVTNEGVYCLLDKGKHLRKLALNYCQKITDNLFEYFLSSQSQISHIEVSGNFRLTYKGLLKGLSSESTAQLFICENIPSLNEEDKRNLRKCAELRGTDLSL